MPGPVPKRSDERIRRNADYPEATKAPLEGDFVAPFAEDENWHPIAKQLWQSAQKSGQSRFYAETDWMMLYIMCDGLTTSLRPQFVGTAKRYNREAGVTEEVPLTARVPMNGATIAAWKNWASGLMLTEADRRRLHVELQPLSIPLPSDGPEDPGDAAVLEFKSRHQV